MKNVFGLLLILLSNTAAADTPQQSVPSRLQKVTVYQQGAQITRSATIELSTGLQEFVIGGLPAEIMEGSLQVKGRGAFTILGTHFQKNYLKPGSEKRTIRLLRDSLNMLEEEQQELRGLLGVYQHEKEILLANKQVGSDQQGVGIAALEEAMAYFRNKLRQISKQETELKSRLTKLEEQIQRIRKQLESLKSQDKEATGEVSVQVNSKQPGEGTLEFTYVTLNAGWEPGYNLRASGIGEPLELTYQARVYQGTGEDWDQVPLVVSTGEANRSNQQPELTPRYVSFIPERPHPAQRSTYEKQAMPLAKESTNLKREDLSAERATSQKRTRQIRTEYKPEFSRRIPGDGKKHSLELSRRSLDADYTYYAAPALREEAFLLARITQWDRSRLLPAPASLFFENTYVGKSFLDPTRTEDTTGISLGRDPAILISRSERKRFVTDQLIGKHQSVTWEWTIECRNTKNQPVDMVINDQLPVSTHEDIEVEPLELSGARYNKEKGYLEWKTTLAPGERVTKKVRFSIKYPKDKKINY